MVDSKINSFCVCWCWGSLFLCCGLEECGAVQRVCVCAERCIRPESQNWGSGATSWRHIHTHTRSLTESDMVRLLVLPHTHIHTNTHRELCHNQHRSGQLTIPCFWPDTDNQLSCSHSAKSMLLSIMASTITHTSHCCNNNPQWKQRRIENRQCCVWVVFGLTGSVFLKDTLSDYKSDF